LDGVDNATLAAVVGLLRLSRRRGTEVDLIGISPALDARARRLGGGHLLLRRP
jgi:ABC-type transporter Mla MlaB component